MKFGKLYYQERLGVDFCQVGYVTKGSVFLKSSMGDIRITEGMFFCTPVNSPYILHTDENWEGAWFHLKNNTFLSNRLKRGCLFKKSKYLKQLYFNAGNYLEELQKEHRSYELLDAYAEIIEICIRLDLAGSEDKGFSEFAAKVRGNPAMFACTDDAAKSLGISRYELDKLCMKRIGLSFAKFLLGARMNAARKYLARKCALDHIAKGVGFADAFAFSKAFRAYHKCTPRDFRKVNGYREVQKFL